MPDKILVPDKRLVVTSNNDGRHYDVFNIEKK